MNALQTKCLDDMARKAIADYNAALAGGGGPVFPDWAVALLATLDHQSKLSSQVGQLDHDLADSRHGMKLANGEIGNLRLVRDGLADIGLRLLKVHQQLKHHRADHCDLCRDASRALVAAGVVL